MKTLKIFGLSWLCFCLLSSEAVRGRMYIKPRPHSTPTTDFLTPFSQNLNNDLLTNTLSSGIDASNKSLKDAGLTLQNHIINKSEMDQEGRKLIQQYNEAITDTREVDQHAREEGVSKKHANWGNKEPEERRLTQVYVSQPLQQMQPVTIAPQQPQLVYPSMVQSAPQVYQVASPQPVVAVPQMQQVAAPVQVASPKMATPQAVTVPKVPEKKESVVTPEVAPKPVKKKTIKPKKEKKTTLKKVKKSSKKGNRKLRWRRRRRRRRHHHHWDWRKHAHQHRYGHMLLHNNHRVNTKAYHKHNEKYYKYRYHPQHNPYHHFYTRKVRKPVNMKNIRSVLTKKLRKAKIHMMSREKFDALREYKVKYAAELWNRTFIYDSVLLIEQDLYSDHREKVEEKMKRAEELEAKATKDIEEFYNKYYEKDPDEIKEEDLVHHIFV